MNALARIDSTQGSPALAPVAAAPRTQRKWPIGYDSIEPLIILIDIIAIFVASLLADLVTRIEGDTLDLGKATGSMLLVSSLFVFVLKSQGLYKPTELMARRSQVRAVVLTWTSVLLLQTFAVCTLRVSHDMPRGAGFFAVFGLVLVVSVRVFAKRLLSIGLSGDKFAGRNIVLVTDQLAASAGGSNRPQAMLGYSVAKRFALPPSGSGSGCRKRISSHVIDFVRGAAIEEIVIEAEPGRWSELRSFVGDLRVLPFPITFVPVGAAAEIFRRPIREAGNVSRVELHRGPLSFAERAAKRTLDLVGAGIALALLSPLLAAAAIAIKLDSSGPIIFRQQRCGFNGRSFAIRKFRTMSTLEDGASIVQARRGDQRVTRVGKWLRLASIDELPQLLNVLEGDMSLVGPRPHALAHDNQFDKIVRNYGFRRRVKPGLTGWAQIHGCRGATPTTEAIERRVEYDLWYIDNWSLRNDLAILLQTPLEVIRARNAF
jgi:Undecaprenyl-phosphate glucose phosphotransferase